MDTGTIHYYDSNSSRVASIYEQADLTAMLESLSEEVPPCSKILELGCGSGRKYTMLSLE